MDPLFLEKKKNKTKQKNNQFVRKRHAVNWAVTQRSKRLRKKQQGTSREQEINIFYLEYVVLKIIQYNLTF